MVSSLPHSVFSFSHTPRSPPPFISREWEEEEDVFRYTLAKKEGKGREAYLLTFGFGEA